MTRRRRRSSAPSVAGLLLLIALAVLFYVVRYMQTQTPPPTVVATTPAPGVTPATAAAGGPAWLKVYFTDPDPTGKVIVPSEQSVLQYVLPVLDAAKQTIDVASFDFNLPSVTDALVRASKRGVKVRMVLDEKEGSQELKASDTPDKTAYAALKVLQDAKIPVIDGGRSNGLMHDKIIIVDGTVLFMGSWNMSYNDTFRNDNNLLQISAPQLIANYQAKFNELFVDKRFGTKAKVGAQTARLNLDGVQVENYFSPPDEVMQKLVAEVNGAKQSVKFMIFTYTHADLANAMIARAKAGVKVEGVIENRGASQGALPPLFCASLPVKTDGNKNTMHHKVIIIDDSTVITGSYNFTKSADDSNDDNVLIIHSPAVAAAYNQEYSRVYGAGEAPTGAEITCPAK
jgi:phosphatidylserine/phosphatidylglycerophosphate/cardiolipin synthase-like enzyme